MRTLLEPNCSFGSERMILRDTDYMEECVRATDGVLLMAFSKTIAQRCKRIEDISKLVTARSRDPKFIKQLHEASRRLQQSNTDS